MRQTHKQFTADQVRVFLLILKKNSQCSTLQCLHRAFHNDLSLQVLIY